MLHIAEERLHAYVDRDRSDMVAEEAAMIELHIAQCDACRAVVDEGALLRQRSNAILARSGPQRVVRPDFAAIQARAGLNADAPAIPPAIDIRRPRRMQRSYVALAWAASLVAALGLGWLTRDLFMERDQVAVEMTSDAESEEAASFDAPAGGSAGIGDAAGIAALPPSAGAGPVEPRAEAESRAGDTAAGAEEATQSATSAASVGRAAGGAGVRQADQAQAQDFSGIGAAGGTPQAAPNTLSFDSARGLRGIAPTGTAGSGSRDVQDAAGPPTATAAPTRERIAQAAAPAPAPEQSAVARAAAAPPAAPAPPPQAAAAGRMAWVELDRAEAERRFGARLLTIPDLRVTRIAVLGSGAGAMARTWFAGAGDVEIALSQSRQSSGLLQVTPAEPFRLVGEMVLMLEGGLPVSTLRELLSRAR